MAYFRTHTPPHTLHIPLSNLPRADLALRPELDAVLDPAGLKPDDLITLSDLPREGLQPQDTRWLLVDHNVLTGDLAAPFSPLIIGCIDHHDDEGHIPHALPPDQPRLFAKCGSCMSLVLDHCQPVWDTLATVPSCDDGTPSATVDAHLAHIALAPILIDTTNLTSKDKTTDWDLRAAHLAESKLLPPSTTTTTNPPYNRTTYHAHLTTLKEAIHPLPYRSLLRKDYKRWTEPPLSVGVSTVPRELSYTFSHVGAKSQPAFLAALRDWAREQHLDVAAVMTVAKPQGVFSRELLVWGVSEGGVKAVGEFERRFGGVLGLESWEDGGLDEEEVGEGRRVCWRQRGVEYSRKQVGPMLREAMREAARL